MPNHNFAVVTWRDVEGFWSAAALEPEMIAATATDPAVALHQVKDYLTWYYKENRWADPPELAHARLEHFRVPVRPEYERDGRTFPCAEPITIRVPAVVGDEPGGLVVCYLPLLDQKIGCQRAAELPGLVASIVQGELRGWTPQQLSRLAPPVEVVLDQVTVTLPKRESSRRRDMELPALKSVAEPLGAAVTRKQFTRAWGRDVEISDLAARLGREKSSVILVGEPGTGKTAVLVNAVHQLERTADATAAAGEEDKRPRVRHRHWLTNSARLVAGMKYLGQWEERCEQVIAELAEIGGILCVENLHDLLREGGSGPENSLAAFLQPYVQHQELQMVVEATSAELDACRRLVPGFVSLFQILRIDAFDPRQAVAVLEKTAGHLQQSRHIQLDSGVVPRVYRLFARFLPYQSSPGRMGTFMRQLVERTVAARETVVMPAHVTRLFVGQTGLPETFVRDECVLVHEQVAESLKQQVIGQDEACAVVAGLVTTFKAGLNDPKRPIGVLLFSGPTGVGKTELARCLSRYLFGHGQDADRIVRLDMSEYAGFDAAERLLGRSGQRPSEWIERVRRQPFVVVLFDEIEKAAPEVLDVLLRLLDEGRLTDVYGRITDFRSAIIIMTTNLGADRQGVFGFGRQPASSFEAEAGAFFRPEFFNRLDAVVVFNALGPEVIRSITRKELAAIAQREGLTSAGIRLTWTDRLVVYLTQQAYDRRYGARPLQRTLERLLVAPLARYLLDPHLGRNIELVVDMSDEHGITITAGVGDGMVERRPANHA